MIIRKTDAGARRCETLTARAFPSLIIPVSNMIERLLHELRLAWGSEQLSAAFSPYRLGEPVATDGDQALFYAAHPIEPFEAVGAVIKLPCPSSESSILHSTFEDRVAALREEARVLGKCRGT